MDKDKNQSGFVTFAIVLFMAVAGIALSSGAVDFKGTSLKEKKLIVNVYPEKLKTGVADYTVNED